MHYNLSRSRIEQRGMLGRAIVSETDSTYTVRVLDMFELVVLKDDKSLTPHMVNEGYWESWITSWVTRWVRPGMTILDVGANCGYYTMLFETLVGRHGRVVAYEPNPVYVECLKKTREINKAKFAIRPVALSDKVGTATLTVPGDFHGSASIRTDFAGTRYEPRPYEVRTTTLEHELQRIVFWNHDVIKLDVEGAEQLVWNGGMRLWGEEGSHTTLVIEYTPKAYTEDFLTELFEWGYVFAIAHDGGEFPVSRSWIENQTDWVMLNVRRKLY